MHRMLISFLHESKILSSQGDGYYYEVKLSSSRANWMGKCWVEMGFRPMQRPIKSALEHFVVIVSRECSSLMALLMQITFSNHKQAFSTPIPAPITLCLPLLFAF